MYLSLPLPNVQDISVNVHLLIPRFEHSAFDPSLKRAQGVRFSMMITSDKSHLQIKEQIAELIFKLDSECRSNLKRLENEIRSDDIRSSSYARYESDHKNLLALSDFVGHFYTNGGMVL